MSFVLSEEQEILKQTAAEFVRSKSPLERVRTLRDSGDPTGFSRELWREMAALGWAGIVVPQEYGGSGLGILEMALIMEEFGRALVPEPMLSTALLGTSVLLFGGSHEQRREYLPPVVRGELLLALGYQEAQSGFDPLHVETRAERFGKRWRLGGEKRFVFDGHIADRIVVSVRTSGQTGDRGGITLFLVDPEAKGVARTRQSLIDGRGAAIVRLDEVSLGDDSVIGEVDRGGEVLEAVIDRATTGLCAEVLGAMCAVFEMTLEYLKTRKQFGVFIGTFQALKHRAARLFVETELSRSAVMGAIRALDEKRSEAAELVSVAKARCSDAFLLAANEAIQMHGGIGMTDEHDVGFFLKRASVAELMFGDSAWHRERYAKTHGY